MTTYAVTEAADPNQLLGFVIEISNETTQLVKLAGIIESAASVTAIVRTLPSVFEEAWVQVGVLLFIVGVTVVPLTTDDTPNYLLVQVVANDQLS